MHLRVQETRKILKVLVRGETAATRIPPAGSSPADQDRSAGDGFARSEPRAFQRREPRFQWPLDRAGTLPYQGALFSARASAKGARWQSRDVLPVSWDATRAF